MIEGRIKKYLAEISLTEQPFVKDGEKKVGDLCSSSGARIVRFVRYEVGEGIERRGRLCCGSPKTIRRLNILKVEKCPPRNLHQNTEEFF